jgi:hypothetical protein
MRMAMPEKIDGDTAGEIEITLTALSEKIRALASHRPHPAAGINGHERGDGHCVAFLQSRQKKKATRKAASA